MVKVIAKVVTERTTRDEASRTFFDDMESMAESIVCFGLVVVNSIVVALLNNDLLVKDILVEVVVDMVLGMVEIIVVETALVL